MNEPTSLPDVFTKYLNGYNLDERAVTFINTATINQLKVYQERLSQMREQSEKEQVTLQNMQSSDTPTCCTFIQPVVLSAITGGVGGGLLGFFKGSSALLAQKGFGAGMLFGCFWGTGKTVLRHVRTQEAGIAEISEENTVKRSHALLTLINKRLAELSTEKENDETTLRRRNVSPG